MHDDVEVGDFLRSGSRVVRISPVARDLICDRDLVADSPARAGLASRLLDLDLADPVLDGLPSPALDELTVVVPVRDDHAGVDDLLTGLSGMVRVVVVDDASRDAGELVRVVDRHGARLVRLDHNLGPAAARNLGSMQVVTPYVAFVDSDVQVSPDALRRLLRHMVDPGLSAVAPRIRATGGDGWLAAYEDVSGSLDLGPVPATTRGWSSVAYVPSACLVVRMADLGAGFDTRMRCGEDVDLVWRMHAEGRRVRHAAEIDARHRSRRSTGRWLGRKAFYGTSAAPLAARHADRVAPAVLTPAAATAVAGVLVQRRWSLALATVAAAMASRRVVSAVPELPAEQKRAVLVATGVGVARQTSGLVLRHWSPAALVLCLLSGRVRRVVAVLSVADGLLSYRALHPRLDPVRFVLARRAEHLAYGAGVWWGALRARSPRCLAPRWLPMTTRRTRR
nr:mycofactocin biosynthesis glycosyltransferase MftF [Aeromicrobium sp. CFBP 8757]